MVCNRLKQFREYNGLDCKMVAEVLGISEEEYKDFERNKAQPDIDMLYKITKLYKITLNEFRGRKSHLTLHSPEHELEFEDVDNATLKMSDLSWEESRLILYYRLHKDNYEDEIIRKILEAEEK